MVVGKGGEEQCDVWLCKLAALCRGTGGPEGHRHSLSSCGGRPIAAGEGEKEGMAVRG